MDNSTLMYLRNLANSSNMAMQSSPKTGNNSQPDRAAMLGLQSFLNQAANFGNIPVDPVLLGSMTDSYFRRLYSDPKFPINSLPFVPAPTNTSPSASSPASSSTSSSSLQSSLLSNNSSISPANKQETNNNNKRAKLGSFSLHPTAQAKPTPEMEAAAVASHQHAAMLALKTLSSQFYSLSQQQQGNTANGAGNSPKAQSGAGSNSFNNGSRFGIADILGLSAHQSELAMMKNKAITSPTISPKSTGSNSSSSSSNLGKLRSTTLILEDLAS